MSKPRVVFAGTPHFALPSLEATLDSGVELVAVYTQPDRPSGRGMRLSASPVKQRALAAGVPVFQPKTLRDPIAQQGLRELLPDLVVVVAYGLILPKAALKIPVHGCWNVHGSMLPRWRGAAPVQRAILAGDTMTGVCLMQMDAGLDTGPVLLPLPVPIAADETSGTLHDKLAAAGAQVLADGLKLLRANLKPVAQPQPADGVTYAAKIEKSEAVLDLSLPAAQLERSIRAFHPWPVAELIVAGERLRIHAACALSARHDAAPGSVLAATRDGLDLACGDGFLRLVRVQREGGRPIAIADYLNARRDLALPA